MPSIYNTVFGGNPVAAALPTYLALTFSTNQVLGWPLESNITAPAAAQWIDANATIAALTVQFSDARQVSTGYTTIFNNVGANAFTVLDAQGNTLLTVAPGAAWILVLADNSTLQGTWRTAQLGAGTSVANAAALAGNGLKAITATLNERIFINAQSTSYLMLASDRAACVEWTGGAGGVFTSPTPAVIGSDWFCYIKNSGTGTLTFTAASGTVDGTTSKTFNPNDSAIVVCDGVNFFTMGFGQSVASSFNFVTISLAGASGTVVLAGAQLNRISYKFTGALAGNTVVQVPATIQQYWVDNETTGAFTLTISAGAGSVTVTQGTRNILYCDGLNVVNAVSTGTGGTTLVADGSAAAPGLAWASDTQMGLYKVGTDTLGVATAGIARISVNASGNVVINAASAGITYTVTGVAATSVAAFNGTDIAVVQLNSSAVTQRAAILLEQGGTAFGRVGVDGGNTLLSDSANSDVCITSTGGVVRFGQQAGTTQVSISSAGVVTLAAATGTTLAVNAGTTGVVQLNSNHASGVGIRFNDTNGAPQSFDIGLGVGVNTPTLTIFDRTNAAVRLSLNAGGAFTINAPTAGVALTVTGASAGSTFVVSSSLGGANGTTDAFINRAGSTANQLSQGPSLQLQDTTNSTSSLFQQSGGQTEHWQLNGGTWRQIVIVSASDFNLRTRDDGGTQQVVGWRDTPPNIIGTNYTVVHADRGKVIQCNANNLTITFPNDATFPVGSVVTIDTGGTTGTVIAAAASASILWYNGAGTVGSRSVASFSIAAVMYHNTSSGSNWALTGSGIS